MTDIMSVKTLIYSIVIIGLYPELGTDFGGFIFESYSIVNLLSQLYLHFKNLSKSYQMKRISYQMVD